MKSTPHHLNKLTKTHNPTLYDSRLSLDFTVGHMLNTRTIREFKFLREQVYFLTISFHSEFSIQTHSDSIGERKNSFQKKGIGIPDTEQIQYSTRNQEAKSMDNVTSNFVLIHEK